MLLVCSTGRIICGFKRNNWRASRALFFIIGLRQAKVVDGIHGNNRIRHGIIVSGVRRFHPRLAGAVRRCVKDVLSLWCLPVLLMFGSFSGPLEARASCWCSVVCCFPPILPGSHWLLCVSPNRSAIGPRRLGFYTVRGSVDPGERRFRSWGVGLVDIRKGL